LILFFGVIIVMSWSCSPHPSMWSQISKWCIIRSKLIGGESVA
jgi:hypothetical protein